MQSENQQSNKNKIGCLNIIIAVIVIFGLYAMCGLVLKKTGDFLSSFSSFGLVILGIVAIIVMIKIVD